MDLDTIIVKDPAQVTEEEKTFLNENAAKLEDDVAKKFGVEKPAPAPTKPEVRGGEPVVPKKTDKKDDEDDDARVNRIVGEAVSPLQQQVRDQQDQMEVDAFIRENQADNPDIGKYRQQMLDHLKNPAYARVPVKNIFKVVAGDDLMKLGAEKERNASKRASNTRVESNSGGRDNNSEGGKGKDWTTASKEDYNKKRQEILGRPS